VQGGEVRLMSVAEIFYFCGVYALTFRTYLMLVDLCQKFMSILLRVLIEFCKT
jgi:hypothetical protein